MTSYKCRLGESIAAKARDRAKHLLTQVVGEATWDRTKPHWMV
jgi:hypothetical protein